jgi:hypothetical protein
MANEVNILHEILSSIFTEKYSMPVELRLSFACPQK